MIGWRLVFAALSLLLGVTAVRADEREDDEPEMRPPAGIPGNPLPATPDRAAIPGGQGVDASESYGGPIWSRGTLFGDPGGYRTHLAAHGISFGLEEQAETLGNPTGGTRRGAAFEGVLGMSLGLDTGKAGLWQGGIFNASAFQIHGRGLSLNNLDNNLNTVSALEALRGTLLYELWFQQSALAGRVDMRVGQLAADQEFMLSAYGELFINNAFGWPSLANANLPSGGPSFPLATPGVRLRATASTDVTLLLGVFNGNPAGPGAGLAQRRDPSGTAFRIHDGALVMGEVQYAAGSSRPGGWLPGVYKLGAWYDSQPVADQRSGGQDPQRHGDWAIYALADQLLLRTGDKGDDGIGAFLRILGAPGDRSLVNFSVDAGVTWKGAIPARQQDTAGIGFGLTRISDSAVQFDKKVRAAGNGTYPLRRHETVLELTYQSQIAPWWQVQPTAQYLFNLQGGVPNPQQPSRRLGDAAVLGLRTAVTF